MFLHRKDTFIFLFSYILSGVRLSALGSVATTGLLYQPRMVDDECGAIGGLKTGRGNRSTRRKPAPAPLCPPQPLELWRDHELHVSLQSDNLEHYCLHAQHKGSRVLQQLAPDRCELISLSGRRAQQVVAAALLQLLRAPGPGRHKFTSTCDHHAAP
jgi:hypothetical protein